MIKGVAAGERQKKVGSAIARCQLIDKADTIIHKLSKGYRQRIGIAQALDRDLILTYLSYESVINHFQSTINHRYYLESPQSNR
jgi:ABC-type taurine transport system ATPase subunit